MTSLKVGLRHPTLWKIVFDLLAVDEDQPDRTGLLRLLGLSLCRKAFGASPRS